MPSSQLHLCNSNSLQTSFTMPPPPHTQLKATVLISICVLASGPYADTALDAAKKIRTLKLKMGVETKRICKQKWYLEIFVEEEFILWHAGDVSAQELLRVGGNGLDPHGPEQLKR
jgi:hypothetical protein